jgi:hypothetical protein
MITKLARALFGSGSETSARCRLCREPLDSRDVAEVEGVCLPCRLEPGRRRAA